MRPCPDLVKSGKVSRRPLSQTKCSQQPVYSRHFYATAIFREHIGRAYLCYLISIDNNQGEIIGLPYEEMGKL